MIDEVRQCHTCQHWDTLTVGQRDEVSEDAYEGGRYCHLLSDGDGMKPNNWLEAAARGSGGAEIVTAPEFGCVHWQKKP